jgi:hypothetical protein
LIRFKIGGDLGVKGVWKSDIEVWLVEEKAEVFFDGRKYG